MKIAISSTGKDLNAKVDPRFGRTMYFIVVDTETMEYTVLENAGSESAHGAGIQTSQLVGKEDISAVITGNLGPNAFQTLRASGIQSYHAPDMTIAEAIDAFKKDDLKPIDESGPAHAGMRS
ncbi:MAG: NifB/NifX family molybdenum-iron cluster-binding protein [candidate division KSB1 bacterium]|jgi:predicted Fe-Mo cluster-binding NifX family protein|nr:NifB/NifX family molybdenum-iron cluster-binding protein [candidate division KSB1 bacterium]